MKILISIKNKIENKEKLTLLNQYYLALIPLMGNVDRVKAVFEVFHIANTPKLFSEDELENIKKCQYVIASIIADGDDELFKKFLGVIKMNNSMMDSYERDLLDKNTKEVTDDVTRNLARSLKEVLSDDVIAKHTGLDIDVVRNL